MLRHAQLRSVNAILEAYEKAQRPRVEAAQDTSRRLARIMFNQSDVVATLRDLVARLVSVEVAIKPIQQLLANPPDPDALAKAALESGGEHAQTD